MARTRAASLARAGSISTRARSVARFTSASRTPATPRSASSTLATHDAHVIPVTTRSRCATAVPSGGLETGTAGRAAIRTLGRGRAAPPTHQDTGRVGVHLSAGFRVERGLPATAIAQFVARPCRAREETEAAHADRDQEQHDQIH